MQPKFEGNALDFGMVIPTPSQPKLHEMPRDFFKHLAVYSIMKKREFPHSKLLPMPPMAPMAFMARLAAPFAWKADALSEREGVAPRQIPAIKILESRVVGSLDYQIIEAGRADDLYTWLKDNNYTYSGDEATLEVLRAEEMAVYRHEDRHDADEAEQGRDVRG